MKVFISWSGDRSHATAQALAPWLKKVIQSVDYWISSEMERGTKWLDEISTSLGTHTFGILCVTPENARSPWLCYEAGALSQHLSDNGRVIPFLLDFASASDLQPPLGQFNACVAGTEGAWQLVKTLNAHAEFKLSESDLRETFNLWWPSLEMTLADVVAASRADTSKRSSDDKLNELLNLVRSLNVDRNVSVDSASGISISRGLHNASLSISQNATPGFLSFLAQRINARTNQLPPGVTLDQSAVDLMVIEAAGEVMAEANTKIELPPSWPGLEERDREWLARYARSNGADRSDS